MESKTSDSVELLLFSYNHLVQESIRVIIQGFLKFDFILQKWFQINCLCAEASLFVQETGRNRDN